MKIHTFDEMLQLCHDVEEKHGHTVLTAKLSKYCYGKKPEFRHVKVGDFAALAKDLEAELGFTVPKVHQAAILQDGTVYTLSRPKRHHDIIRYMAEDCGLETPIVGEQGFVLQDGSFVDRKAGLQVALLAGQLTKPRHNLDELFSEDLW